MDEARDLFEPAGKCPILTDLHHPHARRRDEKGGDRACRCDERDPLKPETDDENGERQQPESFDEQPAKYPYVLKCKVPVEDAIQLRCRNLRGVKLRDSHDHVTRYQP